MAKRGTKAGITGGKELAAKFREIGREVKTEVEQALVKGALRVERDAKINAPVDTGRMRASITNRLVGAGSDNPVAEVGTSVVYAPYVEFSTSKSPAKPFLFPAYNQNKDKIMKDIAAAFKKGCGL